MHELMKRKLVLIGGGGHCKSVLDAALRTNKYDEVVITDPEIRSGTEIFGCRVVGSDDILPELKERGFTDACITVGNIGAPLIRKKLAEKGNMLGFEFPAIVDPSAVVSDHARIGRGTFVGKNAVVNADATIREHCIINSGSIIEHECNVGAFSHVAVGTVLCGNSAVGSECFIGAGSTVIQGIVIGSKCMVGAGALVNRNLPDNCTAVGIPAKVIKSND